MRNKSAIILVRNAQERGAYGVDAGQNKQKETIVERNCLPKLLKMPKLY